MQFLCKAAHRSRRGSREVEDRHEVAVTVDGDTISKDLPMNRLLARFPRFAGTLVVVALAVEALGAGRKW